MHRAQKIHQGSTARCLHAQQDGGRTVQFACRRACSTTRAGARRDGASAAALPQTTAASRGCNARLANALRLATTTAGSAGSSTHRGLATFLQQAPPANGGNPLCLNVGYCNGKDLIWNGCYHSGSTCAGGAYFSIFEFFLESATVGGGSSNASHRQHLRSGFGGCVRATGGAKLALATCDAHTMTRSCGRTCRACSCRMALVVMVVAACLSSQKYHHRRQILHPCSPSTAEGAIHVGVVSTLASTSLA